MSSRPPLRFLVCAGGLTLIVLSGIAYQQSESRVLRLELQKAKRALSEIVHLRKENERLKSRQISAAELEQLRSDHAALPRLRAEVSELKRRVSAAAP